MMSRFSIGPVSVLFGSLLLFGCEAQNPGSDEGEDIVSTTGGVGSDSLSSFGESSAPDLDTLTTTSVSSSVDTSSTQGESETASSTSDALTTTSSTLGTTSQSTEPAEPQPRTLVFSVPDAPEKRDADASQLRINVSPMGSSDASKSLFDQKVQVSADRRVEIVLSEPETKPDQASRLVQYMVTLYRDKNEDGKPGEGDAFEATVLEFLVFRANLEPELRWRKFDPKTRKAVKIDGAIEMIDVWNKAPRKEALLGGKVSKAPKDIQSVALFSDVEKLDLKRNFLLADRSLDYKIPRDKLFWEAKVSGNMDRRRWSQPDRPLLSGIGRHGLSWFSGYHTPTPTLFPTVRRNSLITDELCHSGQPLVAIWIEESKTWIRSMSGAFVVAYHDLAPGWNIVKIERSPGKQVTFHPISKQDRYELDFSPVCSGPGRAMRGSELRVAPLRFDLK